ncbi:MAG: hypothetical protein JO362_24380, partial [Streptomycetaceae bacterium]|nr:hypothetical protein [Streptomycetaceae bacterium]
MPGDPQVLQQIVDDFTYLRDVAWSVSQGLDAFVASASSGGFEGATAEALRGVISGRLKGFIYNIARAFSLAGEVVAGYRMVLVRAQQTVGKVVTQAESLTAKDPKLGDLKDTVFDQLARVRDAEAVMVRALQDASEMVSQPVKVPSLFARIWKEVEIALIMVAVVAMLASTVVTGPLWEIGLAAGAAQFAMMGVDYAEQRTSLKALLMSALGVLAPGGKGIWMLEELGAGLRGMLARVGKAVDVLANPARLVPLSASDPVRVSGLLATGRRGVAAFAKAIPGVIGEDFARAMERYPTLMSLTGKYLGYAVVNIGRFAGVMFTPMTFGEMVKLGFRGAWAAAWRQASWTGMGEAFRAGWTAKEWQTTQASMDVWRMLHGMRPVLTEAKGAPKAGPGKWMGSEERLREPVVPSVTGGASRDRAYAFSFVPSGSGRLLLEAPAPRTVHGLETSGIPAGSLQRQKLVQDGEDGYLTTRGGLLVPAESMLSPQTLRSLSRFGPQGAERLLTGDFEAAVGPEGVTIHLDGITPVPDQDDPATLGVSTWSVVNRQL